MNEDEPMEREVAIDPEMLGKVFENLLDVKDRKSKGAFYTPREIVHYMCQETLINHLFTNLKDKYNIDAQEDITYFIHNSDRLAQKEKIATEKEGTNTLYRSEISDVIRNNAEKIDNALENIKVCDPAIGSGAFPVGMMNEIV